MKNRAIPAKREYGFTYDKAFDMCKPPNPLFNMYVYLFYLFVLNE